MKKYVIKEEINKIISRYEKIAKSKNLAFRIIADSYLPEELTGDIDAVNEVICLLTDDAFDHTAHGKVVIKFSRENANDFSKPTVGESLPIVVEVIDTRDYYDIEAEHLNECRVKLIMLDSSLNIDCKEKLGAKVSFTVSQRVECENTIDDWSFVCKSESQENQKQEESPIKGVDMVKGLKFLQGNQTIYEKFMLEYVKAKEDFFKKLTDFFDAQDLDNYRIVAHSIKSSSYTIGADVLGDLAKDMEFAARDNDLDTIKSKHDSFKDLYAETVGNIAGYLVDKGIVIDSKPETELEQLFSAIDDFEQEKALEILDKLAVEADKQELIGQIREKIENLDYFGAAELAEQLK